MEPYQSYDEMYGDSSTDSDVYRILQDDTDIPSVSNIPLVFFHYHVHYVGDLRQNRSYNTAFKI